jgi:hypothetical protein
MTGDKLNAMLKATFFGESVARQDDIKARDTRFAHYTSAEVAMSIIQNKSVWMRNAITMNDFSEISYGKNAVFNAWKSPGGEKLRAALEGVHAGVVLEIETLFNSWQGDLETKTYLTSLSEHDAHEDNLGRLSMWRAYGGRNGVALILNRTPLEAESNELKAYTTPVFYGDQHTVEVQFDRMANDILQHIAILQSLPMADLMNTMFVALRFIVLGTKHPAFGEEREWRVIYSPSLELSPVIEAVIHPVRGVPQIVQKIPLRNDSDNGLHGAAIPDLLHRLIIGPTEDPVAMRDAFVVLLEKADVPNPLERVWMSGIPLRQW